MPRLFVAKECNWQLVMYDASMKESVQTLTTKAKSTVTPIAFERCSLKMGELLDDEHRVAEPVGQQTRKMRVEDYTP